MTAQAPAAAAAMVDEDKLRELTQAIAYEAYERRGHVCGRDVEDWLAAEKIAREQLSSMEA